MIRAAAALAVLLSVTAAPAEARESDPTPGCVDFREYRSAEWVDAKAHVDARLGSHGYPAMFSGEVNADTGDRYVNHSPAFVKYV
jgi:hypothetical protein